MKSNLYSFHIQAAARASSETASDAAEKKYKMMMDIFVDDFKHSVSPEKLNNWHLEAEKQAMESYVQMNKIGEIRQRIFRHYQECLTKVSFFLRNAQINTFKFKFSSIDNKNLAYEEKKKLPDFLIYIE